jgi:excisionase family DNA binding protein
MIGKLLNTAEAARFLRVSDASIRRWSDAGQLASRRVGGRRERRFSESDLVRFLNRDAGAQAGPLSGAPSPVNVGGTVVPVPGHVATFHSDDASALRLTVPFLADGLRAAHPCSLVADEEMLERYWDALSKEPGIDPKAAVENGQLQTGTIGGGSSADALEHWEKYFAHALRNGPTVIRIVGEMVCERKMFSSDAEMMRYEEAFEVMARRYPVVVVCQYDVREFDGQTILKALKTHPDLFDFRLGAFLR